MVRFLTALVAVVAKSVGNLARNGLVHDRCSAKISLTLLAHASCKVAGSGLAMLRFSRSRQAKSLFRALVRLLFWHQIALNVGVALFEAPHFRAFADFVLVHLRRLKCLKSAVFCQNVLAA